MMVEAARAGDAGRGFSVVATEVLALAQRSADAASKIKELLAGSHTEIDRGSHQIRQVGESFSEIAEMIIAVCKVADTVAQSTEEQSEGLRSLNASISELDQVTQRNVAMFEETATSTQTLLSSVDELLSASNGWEGASTAHAEPAVESSVDHGVGQGANHGGWTNTAAIADNGAANPQTGVWDAEWETMDGGDFDDFDPADDDRMAS